MINPKGRAVTIDVQEKTAVGLWVRPNDHVDVIGNFRDPENQQLKTVTLLQNVVVLATGRITANTTYVPDEEKKFQTGERASELQQKRYRTIQIIRGNKSTTNESTGVAAKTE